MNLNFINKYPKLKNWLLQQVNYYSKGLYFFNEGKLVEKLDNPSKIIIVAKCHYNETWQSFSSLNRKELDKILTLKKEALGNTPSIFQAYKSKTIDGFDVKITTFDTNLISKLGYDKVFLPDSELFTPSENNQLLQIETPAGEVFCSFVGNKVKTSYAKGIVKSIDTYKLSVGLSDDTKSITIKEKKLPEFLLFQLLNLNITKFFKISFLDVKAWFNPMHLHFIYIAPLVTALLFYITTNGYLLFKTNSLEEVILKEGAEINSIIHQKKLLDENIILLKTLTGEFTQQEFIHSHWQLIDELLTAGMQITRMNYSDHELIVRGLADKASDILSIISKNKKVTSAAFQGPVRKSRNKDSFILTLKVGNCDDC